MNWEKEIIKIIREDEYDKEDVGHNETTLKVCNFIREHFLPESESRPVEGVVMPKIADIFIPKSIDGLQKESFDFAISKVNWYRNKSPKYNIEDTELIRFAEYYNLYKNNFSA